MSRKRKSIFPLGLIVFEIGLGLFGPLISPYAATRAVPQDALLGPSWAHWFGTNSYGADVLSRVLTSARVDLEIAVTSKGLAFVIGTPIGRPLATSNTGVVLVMRLWSSSNRFQYLFWQWHS